jgi:uncharacterized protein YjbI with pentapeptide repeats
MLCLRRKVQQTSSARPGLRRHRKLSAARSAAGTRSQFARLAPGGNSIRTSVPVRHGPIWGSDAVLTGADLYNALLNGANLTGANLNSANLMGANLSGAILDDAT